MDKHDECVIAAVIIVPLLFLTVIGITSCINERYGMPKQHQQQKENVSEGNSNR